MAYDVQIAGAAGAAPQTYEVPNSTEIVPRAVFATFDGTGAAVPFFPTVQIISDGGVIVAECPTDATVAAGGSASVSFFPFNRAAATGSGGITTITSTGGTIGVTNPNGPTTNLEVVGQVNNYEFASGASLTIANGSADSLHWSHANGNSLWDYTINQAPLTKAAGIYAVCATVFVSADFTAGGYAELSFAMGDGGVSNQTQYTIMDSRGRADGAGYGMTLVHYMSTSARWSMSITNKDGASSRTFSGNAYAVRIT